jgi:hypothetical protein
MRGLAVGGGVLALSVFFAAAVPAQTLLDRPLWQFLEPAAAELPPLEPLLDRARHYGPTGTTANGGASANGELSESEFGSLGCIVGGTLGTAAAIAIGGPNIINLIAGGIVPAATPGALYTALAGVVFASFCAVGQAATPAVLLAYRNAATAFAWNDPVPAPQPAPTHPNDAPPPLLGRLIKIGYAP